MTLNRFEWSEIAIVGGVGGVAGGVLALAIRLGATVDNLLNFLGGAVGSGLAIAATLWLERRRRARALKQMLDSLVIVADASLRFRSITDDLTKAMVLTFQQSVEALEASKLGASIENPLHQYGFHSAMFWLKRSIEEMKGATDDFDKGNVDLPTFSKECKLSASCISGSIEDFLRMEGLPRGPIMSLEHLKSIRQLEYLKNRPDIAS
jgi:hypothetical protein